MVAETASAGVMGLEAARRLQELPALVEQLQQHWPDQGPVVHIPVDSPAAQFRITPAFRDRGAKTVHWVAPYDASTTLMPKGRTVVPIWRAACAMRSTAGSTDSNEKPCGCARLSAAAPSTSGRYLVSLHPHAAALTQAGEARVPSALRTVSYTHLTLPTMCAV